MRITKKHVLVSVLLIGLGILIVFLLNNYYLYVGGGLVVIEDKYTENNRYFLILRFEDYVDERPYETTKLVYNLVEVDKGYSMGWEQKLWHKYPQITDIEYVKD